MTVIGFVSAKGGVGKTTIVANLGIALVKYFGKTVLLVDGNITTPTLGIHLGIVPKEQTFMEVLKNEIPIDDAIYMHPSGVNLLPASLVPSSYYPNPEGIKDKLAEIRDRYDYVIIDSAAGIGNEVLCAMDASDGVFVVTNADLTSSVSALKIIRIAEMQNVKVAGIVLNKVTGAKFEMKISEIEELCGRRVVGVVPFSNVIPESIANQAPFITKGFHTKPGESIMKLASFITREEYEEENILKKIIRILTLRR